MLKINTKTRVTKRQVIRSKLRLSGKKTVQNPLHKIYMGMVEHWADKVREIQALIEQKVKIISVKEGRGIPYLLNKIISVKEGRGIPYLL